MKDFNFSIKRQYSEVLNNLPYYPSGGIDPTQFNNDKSEIYLASIDSKYETKNVKDLESALDAVLSSFKGKLAEKGTAHGDLKLAICRCDFNEVALLLHDLRSYLSDYDFRDNTNYAYPDELFDELLSK
ncbi:MAG TPA: hypothetical protein DEF26_03215 [Acinetobacter sp.]|nr:hypothetical protein [Acinetobacter sp.]